MQLLGIYHLQIYIYQLQSNDTAMDIDQVCIINLVMGAWQDGDEQWGGIVYIKQE
jgi:hypothetical protein